MDKELLEILARIDKRTEATQKNVERLEQRFDGLEQRFDGLEQRFDGLEKKVDGLEQRFDGLEQRFDGLEQKVDGLEKRFDGLEKTVQEHSQWLSAMRTNMEMMDAKLDRIETTTASIKQVQDLRRTIGERLESMGRELLGQS